MNDHEREVAAKVNLLEYLIQIATETQGAEVWRALFAEMRTNLLKEE